MTAFGQHSARREEKDKSSAPATSAPRKLAVLATKRRKKVGQINAERQSRSGGEGGWHGAVFRCSQAFQRALANFTTSFHLFLIAQTAEEGP